MHTSLRILAVSMCALSQPLADSESPRRLLQLNVAATDQKGDPVTDLRASDSPAQSADYRCLSRSA